MSEPVSIVLPTYNRERTIQKAIESVLASTYPHFELIIVDDASTDHTKEVVNGIKDKRVRYEMMPENGGASAARNAGIRLASYDYIAFEDSDDLWRMDKLEKQMRLFSKYPEIGFCYHKISYEIGPEQYFILPDEKIPKEKKSGNIYEQLLYDNLVDCPSLIVKKACLEETGVFDDRLPALEDYDLVLRLAKRFPAGFIDEVLLDSEYSTTGVSGSPASYLMASCLILGKYKQDYLATDTFNHRLEVILKDSERTGVRDQIIGFLEKILKG